jgi:hypothetical protein
VGVRNLVGEQFDDLVGFIGRARQPHRLVGIETAKLKEELGRFGVSAFVAHEDILATRKWQNEIENAHRSMDAFAALMTDDFHDSDWTDQEAGFASRLRAACR